MNKANVLTRTLVKRFGVTLPIILAAVEKLHLQHFCYQLNLSEWPLTFTMHQWQFGIIFTHQPQRNEVITTHFWTRVESENSHIFYMQITNQNWTPWTQFLEEFQINFHEKQSTYPDFVNTHFHPHFFKPLFTDNGTVHEVALLGNPKYTLLASQDHSYSWWVNRINVTISNKKVNHRNNSRNRKCIGVLLTWVW